jgi:hypothetical protein
MEEEISSKRVEFELAVEANRLKQAEVAASWEAEKINMVSEHQRVLEDM